MKLFVWDFHGVLEQGNEFAVIETSNIILGRVGYRQRFCQKDIYKLYGLKWYEYFEYLLPDLNHQQHLDLQTACIDYARSDTTVMKKHIRPTDHAKELLQAIKNSGHEQVLLSNTHLEDLQWFVRAVGLDDFFKKDHLVGVNPHDKAASKKEAFRAYIKGNKYDQIIIIGDSQADMELKDVAGGITYFYSHPHVEPRDIAADYKIRDLRQVLKQI